MGRKLLLFCLVLVEVLVLQALADTIDKNPFGVKVQTASRIANPPAGSEAERVSDRESESESESESSGVSEGSIAPASRRLGKHHSDKSVAGGGVIIGGLVTAIFAAIFCYIRVTRKRDNVGGL